MVLSIEESALDLGAKSVRAFFGIALPVIAPAQLSAWLLAYMLSLDDLVIVSLVSGPSANLAEDRVVNFKEGEQESSVCLHVSSNRLEP